MTSNLISIVIHSTAGIGDRYRVKRLKKSSQMNRMAVSSYATARTITTSSRWHLSWTIACAMCASNRIKERFHLVRVPNSSQEPSWNSLRTRWRAHAADGKPLNLLLLNLVLLTQCAHPQVFILFPPTPGTWPDESSADQSRITFQTYSKLTAHVSVSDCDNDFILFQFIVLWATLIFMTFRFRFVIRRAVVRKDLIQTLPLPRRLLDYLSYKNCYSEQVESDSSQSPPPEEV